MRIIFLLLFLYSSGLSAQTTTYSKIQYRLNWNYVYAMPQGQFSSGTGNRFFAGQCANASGSSFTLGVALPNHFAFGFHFSAIGYKVNRDKFYAQLVNQYADPGSFTTVSVNKLSYAIGSSSLEASYIFTPHFAEIEPYLLIGLGYEIDEGYGPAYTIHRKEKNSNYAEDIESFLERRSFFLPGIGVRANKKIWNVVYLTAGIQYNYGVSKYSMNGEKTDFLGNMSFPRQAYSQPVSAIQAKAGVEVRFRAKRHLKPAAVTK